MMSRVWREFVPARLATRALAGCVFASVFASCSGPAVSSPPRRPREVAREEAGVIVGVNDVLIDPATGPAAPKVGVPVPSPLGIVRVPVRVPIGGSPRSIPGEELAVRVGDGRTIVIVQERGDPPFAVGERVRVLHERENLVTGVANTRIEREP